MSCECTIARLRRDPNLILHDLCNIFNKNLLKKQNYFLISKVVDKKLSRKGGNRFFKQILKIR